MINDKWKQQTIEKMAKAMYELYPYDKDYMKNWEGLCDIVKRKANGYNYIGVRYKRESLERATAAFNTFIQELPEMQTTQHPDAAIENYTQLIAMKD